MTNEKKLNELRTLHTVSSLINSTLDPPIVREKTIAAITTLLGAEAGSLLLLDDEKGDLFFDVATGEKGGRLRHFRLAKGEGIAGWVAEHEKYLIVNDVRSDPRFSKKADEKSGFITKSILCVPLRSKGRVIGVIEGINKKKGAFLEEDAEVMTALADQVAIAVENAELYAELKEAFYSMAEALAGAIELRDSQTGIHIRRVMDYSLIIGRYLKMNQEELETLRLSAALHDIGKLGVRDDILLKQGYLTEEELQAMKCHPDYGSEILTHIKHLNKVIPVVRSHHEHYDGKGYPDGLKNSDIPIAAKIIAVADAFDAMTTDRPYKKKLSVQGALEELKRCSGTQFAPEVVDALLTAWNNGELHFP
jgi:HD-GYP domain-containing protein (c-di-GMP phosphodiesterase class II)